jgi:hypothetical protein
MTDISQNTRTFKKLARRLRVLATRRMALTDDDIEQFLIAAGLGRVSLTFEKLTEPRVTAPAD